MVVNYFGEGCFRLQSGELSLLVNPSSNRLKADVILKTITVTEDPVIPGELTFPGEYEIKGIEIQGFPIREESTDKFAKTIFAVTWEEMRFAFLGQISGTLSAEHIEQLGDVDVLFVPTGDSHFIAPEAAARLVKQIEPKVTIPAFYKSAADFLKAMGLTAEKEEKWVFRKKELNEMKGKVMVLESKA